MASEDHVEVEDNEEVVRITEEEKEDHELSFQKLRRYDSLDVESAKLDGHHHNGSKVRTLT